MKRLESKKEFQQASPEESKQLVEALANCRAIAEEEYNTGYQVGKCLGSPRQHVQRAVDINTGASVATKRHREQSKFKTEPKFLKFFTSRGSDKVIKLTDVDEQSMTLYLELAVNGSLDDMLKKIGRIQQHLAKVWVEQAIDILRELHDNSIVHNDFKPENLLVFNAINPKLKAADLESAAKFGAVRTEHVTPYICPPRVGAADLSWQCGRCEPPARDQGFGQRRHLGTWCDNLIPPQWRAPF